MKKRISFAFYCPHNKIGDTLSFRRKGQQARCQRKLLKFVKKHKKLLKQLVMHIDLISYNKTFDGKRIRIYLYQSEDYDEEFAFMVDLLWFNELRQLFGNVFYGLSYKLPSVPDTVIEENPTNATLMEKSSVTKHVQVAPVEYVSAVLNQEDSVLYGVLDEFIKDIDSILMNDVTIENAKFDWTSITIESFHSRVQTDEDFKASLKQLNGNYPFLINSERTQ